MDSDTSPHTQSRIADDVPRASAAMPRFHQSLGWIEHHIGRGGDRVWRSLKSRPLLGVAGATALGLGLAMTVGASELAFAVGTGYAAYQILLKKQPPSKAIEEVAKIGL